MRRITPWEELTIKDNFLFLKVMRDERLCRRLLECLLGIRIDKISFPQTEKSIDTDILAKSIRLDVYVEDDSGRVFDIEMQAANMEDDELALRTRYYQSMIDQSILEKGQSYGMLRESYIIFVCAFDPFGLDLRRYTFRNRCDERPDLALSDRAVRIFLNARGRHGEEGPDVQGFLDYVDTNRATEGFAAELASAVERMKADGEERKRYMTLAMDLQRYTERNRDRWIAEGEARGKARGRAEARAEIAIQMLEMGMTVEQIIGMTGLTAEEVRKLHDGADEG